MSGKSTQNIRIHIFSPNSISLDIDELSCKKVLSHLFTRIYIYRLEPTHRKAHWPSKVSICIVCLMTCYFLVDHIMGKKVCIEGMQRAVR